MQTVNVYAAPGERTSPRFCAAFAAGAGCATVTDGRLRAGDVALFGSPQLWDLLLEARAAGRTWYFGDNGYFRRGEYYRVTRDGFQAGREPRAGGEARFDRLDVQIKPWRRGGRHVLVCPPGAVHAQLMRRAGVEIAEPGDWGAWAARELARFTDRPVRIRTKAEWLASRRPLAEDLEDCWAVVAFMSNTALEAAMAGIPVFILGPAASSPLGLRELERVESPVYPENRREIASSLAAQQWTLDEISAGDCWRALS